jgi:hypothetical protein
MCGRARTLVKTGRVDSGFLSSEPSTVDPMSALVRQ